MVGPTLAGGHYRLEPVLVGSDVIISEDHQIPKTSLFQPDIQGIRLSRQQTRQSFQWQPSLSVAQQSRRGVGAPIVNDDEFRGPSRRPSDPGHLLQRHAQGITAISR
jgi:hypothetical protein